MRGSQTSTILSCIDIIYVTVAFYFENNVHVCWQNMHQKRTYTHAMKYVPAVRICERLKGQEV